jgi:hypothetical protein
VKKKSGTVNRAEQIALILRDFRAALVTVPRFLVKQSQTCEGAGPRANARGSFLKDSDVLLQAVH